MHGTPTSPQEFLQQEENQNKEVENKISLSERQCAQVRLDYQESERARLQLSDEVRVEVLLQACALIYTYSLSLSHTFIL